MLEWMLDDGMRLGVFIVSAVMLPMCSFAFSGERQRREAGGSKRQLWLVAATATAISLVPFGISLIACGLAPNHDLTVLGCGVVLSLFAGLNVTRFVRPPVFYPGIDDALPLVTDDVFLNRISELAARMELDRPTIRLLRSTSADQQSLAWAGGLPKPSLVVTDGMLHRLGPDERDAIVAHEMAHIANGSLWVLAGLFSLSCSLGVLAFVCGVVTWPFLVPALHVGLSRIISRRIEFDCDLRAARAMGFAETAEALAKIHTIGFGRNASWLQRLLFASDHHPARDNRIAHIARCAPAGDPARIVVDKDAARTNRRLSQGATALWLIAVVAGTVMGQIERPPAIIGSALLLSAISLTPRLIRVAVSTSSVVSLFGPVKSAWFLWMTSVAVAAISLITIWQFGYQRGIRISSPTDNYMFWFGVQLAVILLVIGAWRQQSRIPFDQAWNRQDFDAVLAIANKRPRWLRRDAKRRSLVAMALAVNGLRRQAVEEFDRIDGEFASVIDNLVAVAALQIEEGQFDEALRTVNRIKIAFPGTGGGEAIEARVARLQGRLIEARQLAALALEAFSESGAMWAAAAGIEVELGNFARAREFLQKARDIEPGTPQELAEEARLAVRTESQFVARSKLQQAIAAYEANPLMLRPSEIASLKQTLAQLTILIPCDSDTFVTKD